MSPGLALRAVALAAVLVCSAVSSSAATRLTYMMGTKEVPVAWPSSAFPIPYELDSRLVAALPNATSVVDRAFAAWANVPDSNISFRSLGVVNGVSAGQNGQNSVSLADDLFRDQKAIALTTNWYDGSGNLTEADIQIDATLVTSDYNIQQAVTHEVGHLLGLDHSAVLSSVMYPYVSRGKEQPQLDSDDRIAIAGVYPKLDPMAEAATLQGRVVGDNGGIFAAQVVAVNEDGEPVATALTDSAGDFRLRGIPQGSYRIYAEPLDGPVDTRNLAGVWRQAANVTPFPTEFLSGEPLVVQNGKLYGNLVINGSGTPPQLNPKWIGLSAPGSLSFNLSSTAATARPATTVSLAIAGDGITGGMTTFEVLNPGVRRVSDFRYAANYVYANFTIDPTARAGSAVVLVTSGNQSAALTGALRIQGTGPRIRIASR